MMASFSPELRPRQPIISPFMDGGTMKLFWSLLLIDDWFSSRFSSNHSSRLLARFIYRPIQKRGFCKIAFPSSLLGDSGWFIMSSQNTRRSRMNLVWLLGIKNQPSRLYFFSGLDCTNASFCQFGSR